MKTETYEQLKKIYDKFGAQEFGKLCQQLLALTLDSANFNVREVRLVEGVDIDAVSKQGNKEKYAIEVKTTVNKTISFGTKDRDGLLKRKEDSYQPVLAVLRLDRFSDWTFANADSIKPGSVNIDGLRVYRLTEIEERISLFFDKTVSDYYAGIMRDGQECLNVILRKKGVKVRQS